MTRLPAALLLLALGGCQGCPPPPDQPLPPPADGAEDEGTAAGRPFDDPDDATPVDPPATEVARIAPTPLDTPPREVVPVPVPYTRPNVVLVVGCTVRKDQLTPYGAPAEVTPFLAELAREGTVFDDLIATAPWTRAASAGLLTGRHAVSIGMAEPSAKRDDSVLPEEVTTLAEHLRARGYLTIGATANPNLNPEFGFDQGFDHYQLGLPATWKAKLPGRELARAALDTLAEARARGDDRPFYLRLMMLDAHAPRRGSDKVWRPWQTEGLPARVALYRHAVHELDETLRQLDEGLRAAGYDERNTLFVFVADHGEGMNYPNHHGFGHGQYFGSSAVHVPWILRGPGVAKGHRVLGTTSGVDVLPTLLGVVGAPLGEDDVTEGRDWSALVRGEGHVAAQPWVISDTWFGGSNRAAIFTHRRQCQKDFGSTERQRRKGKFVDGACFDRLADPLFTRPIEDASLLDTLVAWRSEREAALGVQQARRATVAPEVAKQLEVLGYVDE